jgi:hypothetical protein
MTRLYAVVSIGLLVVAAGLIYRAAPQGSGVVVIHQERVIWATPGVRETVREVIREVTVAPPTWTPFPTPHAYIWPTATPVVDFSGAVDTGSEPTCEYADQVRGTC